MPAHIRLFEDADLRVLHANCWPERPQSEIDDLENRIQQLRSQHRGEAIVYITDDQTPVAFGMLTLWGSHTEISDLVVSASMRNRGIGSQLIQQLCSISKRYGFNTVVIGAFTDNTAALRLYKRLNFEPYKSITLGGNHLGQIVYLRKHLHQASSIER